MRGPSDPLALKTVKSHNINIYTIYKWRKPRVRVCFGANTFESRAIPRIARGGTAPSFQSILQVIFILTVQKIHEVLHVVEVVALEVLVAVWSGSARVHVDDPLVEHQPVPFLPGPEQML